MLKEQGAFLTTYFNFKGFFATRAFFAFYNKAVVFNRKWPAGCLDIDAGLRTVSLLSESFNLQYSSLSPKTLNKRVFRLSNCGRVKQLLSSLFFDHMSLFAVEHEIQTLFLLTNSTQQHHINVMGVNYRFYKNMSSGRCLRRSFGYQVSKSLKKSTQLNKALVDYYFEESTLDMQDHKITHTVLKPFNRKALILLDQIQSNALYYPTVLGFTKYYKTNYKTARRIRKKVKKTLTTENLLRQPYKYGKQ